MATPTRRPLRPARRPGRALIAALMIGATSPSSIALAGDPPVVFYSTAAPPATYPGPAPTATPAAAEPAAQPAPDPAPDEAPKRLAAITPDVAPPRSARVAPPPAALPLDPIAEAKAAIASCRASYAKVQDYTCTFFKRERIDGRLSSHNVMHMKARTKPMAVYFKFIKPTPGREAIYAAGGFGGKAVVHDVGIGKLLAGTLRLDPNSSMAMDGCRHPITEAGIGSMIDTIITAWDKELHASESKVAIRESVRVGDRTCRMIESVHPAKKPGFMFHMVKVYIDAENNLPIRFEAYDWPRNGRPAELVEEYTYSDLKLNVGLSGRDFDPANSGYSFGRF